MNNTDKFWLEAQQRIRLAEERRRKEELRKIGRYKGRCLKIGEKVLASFPHLAEVPEEVALLALEQNIQHLKDQEK